jgi:hypothetical protein
MCMQLTIGFWCISGPFRHSISSFPPTAVVPLSINRDLLTTSCDSNSSRARFKINSPNRNPLHFLATGTASWEALS